jgi:hypothetical protein
MGDAITVKVTYDESAPVIMADRTQIEQVLLNLAANARDAMPAGGIFSLSTQAAVVGNNFIKQWGKGTEGRFVCLSAADTGTGMDPEALKHIFEPFFTTKAVGQGTGLGLSISYGIIEQQRIDRRVIVEKQDEVSTVLERMANADIVPPGVTEVSAGSISMIEPSRATRRSASTEPSEEPLSTTTILRFSYLRCEREAIQASVSSRPFQLSTTIVARS